MGLANKDLDILNLFKIFIKNWRRIKIDLNLFKILIENRRRIKIDTFTFVGRLEKTNKLVGVRSTFKLRKVDLDP